MMPLQDLVFYGKAEVVFLFTFLMTKHFIADFLLQFKYQYENKGTYGHPGGLIHAYIHGALTTVVLAPFLVKNLILIGVADAIIHYHIDWAKVNINKYNGWTPVNSEKFWLLLGMDQYLHQLTYIVIVYIIIHS